MCISNDGFYISEQDLKLRGPGDFFGTRQHGLPEMRIANLLRTEIFLLCHRRRRKRLWRRTDIWSPKSTADFVNVPKV